MESVQGAERVEPAQGALARGQPGQGRHSGFVLALDEQTLSGNSPPLVGMTEVPGQLRRGSSPQMRLDAGQAAFGSDSVDPAAILAGPQIQLLSDFLRDVVRVFDH